MSKEEAAAVDRLLEKAERFERSAKLFWMLGAAIVAVTLWVAKIQSKVDQVDGLSASVHRIDRNLARLGDKYGLPLEPPKD